ncbi:MoaD/ThiS family protein [Natranaerobius trueperi]|uniref:MoaD/ThiS family protein n=1 Tax=Natranaerobius trueperi TaxID=759412 RepID=UPI001303D78B|nr:MoaD/ThiS family protein [Natranaerobius trueperi]
MAKVEIRCFATLRDLLPFEAKNGVYKYETRKTTIEGIVEELSLPKDKLHLILKNGVRVELNEPIKDGDRIGLFPPIGGG